MIHLSLQRQIAKKNILIDVRKNQADKLKFFLRFELVNEKKGKDKGKRVRESERK